MNNAPDRRLVQTFIRSTAHIPETTQGGHAVALEVVQHYADLGPWDTGFAITTLHGQSREDVIEAAAEAHRKLRITQTDEEVAADRLRLERFGPFAWGLIRSHTTDQLDGLLAEGILPPEPTGTIGPIVKDDPRVIRVRDALANPDKRDLAEAFLAITTTALMDLRPSPILGAITQYRQNAIRNAREHANDPEAKQAGADDLRTALADNLGTELGKVFDRTELHGHPAVGRWLRVGMLWRPSAPIEAYYSNDLA